MAGSWYLTSIIEPSAPIATESLKALERRVLDRPELPEEVPAVFILGSPRTGSTFLYQVLVSAFGLPFLDNLTNEYFPTMPALGVVLGHGLRGDEPIGFSSRYGKAAGLLQPSEGSGVMSYWFGGGHPSQLVSSTIRSGMEPHMLRTLRLIRAALGAPLVIKNAWNCFRTEYLRTALPQANFVWVRRDIRAAAKSDLSARYDVQGDPNVWNSATPANVDALRERPYWEQVVENQFEFGRAIASSMSRLERGRWIEVWLEDLVTDTAGAVDMIGGELSLLRNRVARKGRYDAGPPDASASLSDDDARNIDRFVESQPDRFRPYVRQA